MWASEYIAAATAQISDPVKAAEVTRELLTHLEEIKAEAMAAGVEVDMAEAMALTRMGPAEALAASLAETHHSPLPWRHYLAVVPLVGLLLLWMGPSHLRWPASSGLFLLLLVTLLPGASVWRRAWFGLRADLRQKAAWVRRQPLREAAKLALLGMAGVGVGWLIIMIGGMKGNITPAAVPLWVTLAGLPLPLAARWGAGRSGLSPYLLVTMGVLEGVAGLLLLGILQGGRPVLELSLIMGALYLPEGLLVTRLLEWWAKRQLSVRVVVEKGAPN